MILTEQRMKVLSTRPAAATQLRAWAKSEREQHIWATADTLPSLERICYALDTTHAKAYGLLISPQFFTIISTYSHRAFTRLAKHYQIAAEAGLCFWWEDSTLHYYEQSTAFFARLRTLPPLR